MRHLTAAKRRTVERAKEISHRIPVGEEGADMVLGKAKRSINKLAIFVINISPIPIGIDAAYP